MSEKWINYRAIYRTALLLQELSGIPRLSYAAMRLCSSHGVREATDWLADDVRGYVAGRGVTDVSELRRLCEWAIDNGYGDIAVDCFRRCPVGALDDLKWVVPPGVDEASLKRLPPAQKVPTSFQHPVPPRQNRAVGAVLERRP